LSSSRATTRDTSATANSGPGLGVRVAGVLVSHFPQRRRKPMCHPSAPHHHGERALRLCRG
jgi:hypothetical protein